MEAVLEAQQAIRREPRGPRLLNAAAVLGLLSFSFGRSGRLWNR